MNCRAFPAGRQAEGGTLYMSESRGIDLLSPANKHFEVARP